jgi:hypothetical protein
MKKNFTHLISYCFALLLLSSGNVWGQSLIGTLENSSTGNGQNVNNAFGAGESSVVQNNSPNQVQAYGQDGSALGTWNNLSTTPPTIQLGDVKNIVIHSYNSSGVVYTSYWQQTKTFTYTRTWTTTISRVWGAHETTPGVYVWDSSPGSPTTIIWPSSPSEGYGGTGSPYEGNYTPGNGETSPPDYGIISGTLKGDGTKFSPYSSGTEVSSPGTGVSMCNNTDSVGTSTPYVAEKASSDNGANLVQLNTASLGTQPYVYDDATLTASASTLPPAVNGTLDPYVRPTTVAVNGEISLTNFLFEDIPWYYTTHRASYSTSRCYEIGLWSISAGTNYPPTNGYAMGSTVSWGGAPSSTPSSSSSTHVEYGDITYTHTYSITITAYDDRVAGWSIANDLGGHVNGAIQILNNADICLTGGITNNSNISKAFLAFPYQETFSLKVGEDFGIVDMVHVDGGDNIYYSDGNYPTSSTPNLLLYKSSVLGVKGNYDAVAKVHTSVEGAVPTPVGASSYTVTAPTTTAYSSPNEGVIEVGPGTTGQDKFFVYSGGTIRNFWSPCLSSFCDSIKFDSDNTPTFIFNTADSLKIYNRGNCCEASIYFADDDAVKNLTVGSGFGGGINHATAAGPLRIWANKGHILFNANATTPNLFHPQMGNDIDIIAQNSYI